MTSFYLFQQTVQQPVSMEGRVSIWENAFVLQAMKETNVKSVSSISVCLCHLLLVSMPEWQYVTCLRWAQSKGLTQQFGTLGVRCHMPPNKFPTQKFDSFLYHLTPCPALCSLVTRHGNNPEAISIQAVPCGRQMCCHAKLVGCIYFQTLRQITLKQIKFELSPLKGLL